MKLPLIAVLAALALGGAPRPKPCPAPSEIEASALRIAAEWRAFRQCFDAPIPDGNPKLRCNYSEHFTATMIELDRLVLLYPKPQQ